MSRAKAGPRRRRKPRARRSVWRWLFAAAGAAVVGIGLLWVLVHRFDWAGPLLAGSLRAVFGADAVARLEDASYAVEDRVNRLVKQHEPPKAYWTVPARPSVEPAAVAPPAPVASFHPENVGPALKEWSAPGDGEWLPIADAARPSEAPRMYKTLLHPDKNRSWAEVFVVAIDLKRVRVLPMPGTQEPQTDAHRPALGPREGRIPAEQQTELLAAFNGGFMTEHGGYGMKVPAGVIARAKPHACTIAGYADGAMRIASWEELAADEPRLFWFRQTPECMWENDKLHAGLRYGAGLKKWGATLDGETVIRRSAIGLNRARDVLYVSITNHTSARVLADGLHHAGASDVAQLDVNWSYPKFVTFERRGRDRALYAVALAPGFEYSEDEYVRKRQRRDFFYVLRRDGG